MSVKLIVFDFDGVVADSEVLANEVLAAFVTELGRPTTVEGSLGEFMGKRLEDVVAAVREAIGRPPPDTFAADLHDRTISRFRSELREMAGLRDYLAAFAEVPRCIASSSSPERLAACLGILDLADTFGAHVYSASAVERGKPHPDIILHVCARFGVDPRTALVIEDSVGGVRAAVAAGAIAMGLLAASHVRDGHAERLRAVGAHYIARDFHEAEAITRTLLG